MGSLNMLMADFGNVQQSTDTADINEGTVGFDASHGAKHNFTNFESVHLAFDQSATMAEH